MTQLIYDQASAKTLCLPPLGFPGDYLHMLVRKQEVQYCRWFDGSWWPADAQAVMFRVSAYEMALNGWSIE